MELKRVQSVALFLLAIFVSSSTAGVRNPRTKVPCYYTALFPNNIKPFSRYNVTVFVTGNPSYDGHSDSYCALEIRFRITSGPDSYTGTIDTISVGGSDTISVSVGNLSDATAHLRIEAAEVNGFYSDEQASTLTVTRTGDIVPFQQILVETDKPFYKPGETLRIRAVLLDSQQNPVINGRITSVGVRDPNSLILRSWKNQSSPLGIWKGELELSSELTLGEWEIEIAGEGHQQVTKCNFTVEKYVPPKWDVKLTVPEYLLRSKIRKQPWTATVEAKYTHGQPVRGNGTLRVKVVYGKNRAPRWSYLPLPTEKTIQFLLESNSTSLSIDMGDLEPPWKTDRIEVELTLTEAVTGIRRNTTTKTIRLEEHPYKVKVLKDSPKEVFDGIPFTMLFQLTDLEDVPIQNIRPYALRVSFFERFQMSEEPEVQIGEHGLITVTLTKSVASFSTGMELTRCLVTVYYEHFKYEHFLHVYERRIRAETLRFSFPNVTVRVWTGPDVSNLNYALLAGEEVLRAGAVAVARSDNSSSGNFDFEFDLRDQTNNSTQKLTFHVFSITEISILEHSIYVKDPKKASGNGSSDLRISVSAQEVKPGENLTLRIQSQPGSLVALKGLDVSGKLLGGARKLWPENLIETDSESPFNASGLLCLTNWRVFEFNPMTQTYFEADPRPPIQITRHSGPTGIGQPTPGSDSSPTIRKYFQETWLWDEFQIPNDTNFIEVNRTAAGTLNSWAISGWSLNPGSGILLLEEPIEFKTFTPFFISLPLPYSVVTGEVLTLKVLVHNYLPTGGSTNVTVIFSNIHNEFEFQTKYSFSSGPAQLVVTCPPREVTSVEFKVKPLKFGDLNLNVQALSVKGGDAVSRTLLVVPPGRKVSKSTSALLIPSNDQTAVEVLKVSWPEQIVPSTDNVKILFGSNVMGSSFQNLDHLIQLPVGCGEQNMLNFVVDILALDYMRATNTIKPKIKEKALKFLQAGYQRQLNYRHEDGSFSAFGKNDERGSTWLTAFIMKSFILANKYIEIDNEVIVQGLNFVRSQQQPDGSFVELGRILHPAMQGGVNSKTNAGLTAYCLLTMLEASAGRLETFNESMERALRFLEGDVDDEHSYTVALTALAQQLALKRNLNVNSTASDIVFEKLKAHAQRDPDAAGSLYWEAGGTSKTSTGTKRSKSINPAAIETTGYALLAYLARDELTAALPIVKWLNNMRNENGGFMSTQDTVVGLMALSQFAVKSFAASPNVQVTFTHEGGSQELTIDASNAGTVNEFSLPKSTKQVEVRVRGSGSVVAQLTWSCYVSDTGNLSAFSVSIKPPKEESAPSFEVCASYNKPDQESYMSIMEVDLPSGHVLNTESMGSVVALSNYKRHEVTNDGTHLAIYFDSMSNNETCAQIVTFQAFEVEESAAVLVRVYDYYDTTQGARAFYTLEDN